MSLRINPYEVTTIKDVEVENGEEAIPETTSTIFDKIFAFDETTPMGDFVKTAIKSILHECIDQLYILRNINSQNKADYGVPVLKYASLEERYMGSEDHAEFRINSIVSSYAKLAKDINTLICILKETSDDIVENGIFPLLTDSTGAILRMHREEQDLLRDYKNNQKYLQLLRRMREEERLENIRTMEETNANIQKLRFEVEDVLVYGKYELGYFEHWEDARVEQNIMVCDNRENVHGLIISDTSNKIEIENRCHAEMDSYIEESKNDYLDEIQYWMKRYDDETDRRENELLGLKADMEKLVDDHSQLRKKYDSRQAEMDDWLEYKREKREKEEMERLIQWAAIKLQSWWRGTMVRRYLGPFKYLKPKKGKKGKRGKK